MKPSALTIFVLLLLMSCGKQAAKKSSGIETFSPANYVDDVETFMIQVKHDFNDQFITDFYMQNTEVVFIKGNVSKIDGQFFTQQAANAYCSHSYIHPGDEILLRTTAYVDCASAVSTVVTDHTGNYNFYLQPELKEALELAPDKVVFREVTYEGITYTGYGLKSGSKEYVLVPELPIVVNPVLIFDAASGEARALEGVTVI